MPGIEVNYCMISYMNHPTVCIIMVLPNNKNNAPAICNGFWTSVIRSAFRNSLSSRTDLLLVIKSAINH